MPKPKDESVNRLAGFFSILREKGDALNEMTRLVEELERGGIMMVAGEANTARRLKEHHSAASEVLKNLPQSHSGIRDALNRLEEELGSADWAALSILHEELTKKAQIQSEIMLSHLNRLAEARSLIDSLQQLLKEALEAHASVFKTQSAVQRYEAAISAAERFLREQEYRLLIQSLDQVPTSSALQEMRDKLKNEIDWAAKYSRQADLLLLQSPLDHRQKRYTYTMLLRTASEPGSHGINIQDSSTLVEQDRASMAGIINSVTEAIDRGLARDFARKAAPPAPPDSILPSDNLAAASTNEPLRHLTVQEEGYGSGTPLRINALLEHMGDLMFRLFMPEWMQRYLQETPCSVMITSNDLELPWELMHYNGEFLCLERPTSRMPMGRGLPRRRAQSIAHDSSKVRFLLIYSDPESTLPAAGKEIELLGEQLRDEWKDRIEVVTLTSAEATGGRLNQELRRGSFDVIHYAGHASFDQETPDLSGLQVSDGQNGKEIYFAQKIRRVLEGRPLVFLNACESARTANETTRTAYQEVAPRTDFLLKPAEGLASAFLYGGALACIGSLWPIYDKAAADFALEFYREALDGSMLGEAMRLARRKIRENYPDQVTWAAFAFYGDGTFRLAH